MCYYKDRSRATARKGDYMKVRELITKLENLEQDADLVFATTRVYNSGAGITLTADSGAVLVISAPEDNQVEIYFKSNKELRW